jgi:periplasmic divalent cation tolerance protein
MILLMVYTTCGSVEEADRIAQTVVREQLAACANRGAPIRSVYMWEGRLDSNDEIPLLLKTIPEKFEPLRARIKALHSYTTPAIVAWESAAVDENYLQWVRANVGESHA